MNKKTTRTAVKLLEDVRKQTGFLYSLEDEMNFNFLKAIAIKEIMNNLIDIINHESVLDLYYEDLEKLKKLLVGLQQHREKGWQILPDLLEQYIELRGKIDKTVSVELESDQFLKKYRATTSTIIKRGMVYSLAIKNFFLLLTTLGFFPK